MRLKIGHVVELGNSAAEHVRARFGKVVQVDDGSVYVRVRPGEAEWFVSNDDIIGVYARTAGKEASGA